MHFIKMNNFTNLCNEKHKLVGSDCFFNCDEMKNNNINMSSTTIHIILGLFYLCTNKLVHKCNKNE